MEVEGLLRSGLSSPKMSQRILVFVTVRRPLREVLLLPHEDEIFIPSFLSFNSVVGQIGPVTLCFTYSAHHREGNARMSVYQIRI